MCQKLKLLSVSVISFQSTTIPTASFENTSSPLLKVFFSKEISNIGKCFCGIILPEEITGLKIPGTSPSTNNLISCMIL
jgi:hypothetical protein